MRLNKGTHFGIFFLSGGISWLSIRLYLLYFGNRLPYCGRSINMDKWSVPKVELFMLLFLIICLLLLTLFGTMKVSSSQFLLAIIGGVTFGLPLALITAGQQCDQVSDSLQVQEHSEDIQANTLVENN